MRARDVGQRDVGERVAVDDPEARRADDRAREARSARAAEHARLLPGVPRADAEVAAVADDGRQRLRPVMQVQHEVVDAVQREPRDDATDHRLAGDGNRRLRAHVGQRPEPHAEAGGENQRVTDHRAIVRTWCPGSAGLWVRLKADATYAKRSRTNTYIVKHSSAKAGNPK